MTNAVLCFLLWATRSASASCWPCPTAEGLNVRAITQKIKLSRPAVSHHLRILLKAGLLRLREDGVQNIYSLSARQSLEKVKAFIDRIESFMENRSKQK